MPVRQKHIRHIPMYGRSTNEAENRALAAERRRELLPIQKLPKLARHELATDKGVVQVTARQCSRPACKQLAVYTLTYVYRD